MLYGKTKLTSKRKARLSMAPPIPEMGWVRPDNPPNLSNAIKLSVDVETRDPDLQSHGPGWARGSTVPGKEKEGYICGFSIAAMDRLGNQGAWYFPIRHLLGAEDNLPREPVLRWAETVLNTPHIPKFGANITYDIGWLREEGVNVTGELWDVQFAEALLDSEAKVALEVLAQKYLGHGKTTDHLKDWCKRAYPDTPEKYWRSNIYQCPPQLVGHYGEGDALFPLQIMIEQLPRLYHENLMNVFRMECDLIPLMIDMRFAGISVDLERANLMIGELDLEVEKMYARANKEFGPLKSSSTDSVAKLFDKIGIKYPRNGKAPSIRKEFLAMEQHPAATLINEIREHEKIIGTFLQKYVKEKNVNGKLYPQFHQMKGDTNGTVVGRFSSSDPNLQNIPARTKLGKTVREVFVPDPGDFAWHKKDQSQVHYRILAHYAVDRGDGSANALRQAYINNPDTDYHFNVYRNVAPLMGWSLDNEELNDFRRRPIKNVNFGLLYGQSVKSLIYKTALYFGEGFGQQQAEEFFAAYFKGAPYIKPTMAKIAMEVQKRGFVETLLGRRIRFNLWVPDRPYDPKKKYTAMSFEKTKAEYGTPLKRAFEYRGVNYKFQGSEPDIIKKGMLDCYKSGVFSVTGVPRVTVHDEINWSLPNNSPLMREALAFITHTMENCIPMRVPLKVDSEEGNSWGTVKKL